MGNIRKFIYESKWKRFHPTAFEAYRRLQQSERLSLDELNRNQEMARRAIVRYAFERTPFYRKFYGASGFELGDVGKDRWFEMLPIVTKSHLRDEFALFFEPSNRKWMGISTTGGSTGTPTKAGYDTRLPVETYGWRLQSWFGAGPWDDSAYVWRDRRKTRLAKFKNALLWWPTRHLKLDATFISEEAMVAFLSECRRIRPAFLQGYVGAVSQLAQFVSEGGFDLRGWRPRFVWTTSAPLSPVQRVLIERTFGAPVCDQYGSCEVGWIAQQCDRCQGLHVNVEHVNVEFVDERNTPVPVETYGRTLLTNLEDFVFPLIRYENGDRGRWLSRPCDCGRNLPCIDSVKGRESEAFALPGGETINGEFLTTIFDAAPDLVHGFRVIQHRDLSITIEYVPAGDEVAIVRILNQFVSRLGGVVAVDFRRVSEIQHDRGKLRFVVREK